MEVSMKISNIKTKSGKKYGISKLKHGFYQYEDRFYQFNYIPDKLKDSLHIKTYGNDKMISEEQECFSFECDEDIELYVIYPDKHPILPEWLKCYERMRMNITRTDSNPANLKGYFSLYKKVFKKGKVTLYGCSPQRMLGEEWYVETNGAGYCMYSVCVKPISYKDNKER